MVENTTHAARAEQMVLENGGLPIGYRESGRFSTMGWAIFGGVMLLVFGWTALGVIQAPIPDYLVHPVFDISTDPLAHFAAWVFGY